MAHRISYFYEYQCRHTWTNFCWLCQFFFYVEYRWRIDETNRWSMRRNQSILMSIQVVIPYFRTHQILFMWSNHPCFFFLGRYWWCRYWWCRCCCYQVSSRMTPCIKNGSNFFFNLHFNDELYHLICQAWSFSLITLEAKKIINHVLVN